MTYRARNLIAAIGLAVVAALFVGFYVSNYKRSVEHSQQHVSVYVAAKNIPTGTAGSDIASKGYLKQEQVLRQSVVPGAISNPSEIDKLVAGQDIYAGEQISLNTFSTEATKGIRGFLRGPMRAFQIAGDANQTLAGTLQAGDHVDFVGNLKLSAGGSSSGEDNAVTRIVLRDLRVLRATAPSGASKLDSPDGGFGVMLAVTDAQAQKLFFVLKNGDWSLELRPLVKAADSPESAETIHSVITDGLSASARNKLLYGTR
jgi:Flp pilus assembly protein CpaB